MTGRWNKQEQIQCAIAALTSAHSEYAKMRVTRDLFLATMPRRGLIKLADKNGNSLEYWYHERQEAKKRLQAAAHKLELV